MCKAKILKEQYDEIIELYKNGLSQEKIAKQYNVAKSTIRDVLVKCNATDLGTAYKVFKTTEEEIEVCDMYLSGMSTLQIGEAFNCNCNVVRRVLKKHDVPRRQRKYGLNEHYFDEINTPNKAYILGLLYADGCNNSARSVIALKLQERDVDILEAIRQEIECDKPLYFLDYANNHYCGQYDCQNQYQLSLSSAYMCRVLAEKGVVPVKILILKWPTFLSDDLYSHFLRGYIDGDGHIAKGRYDYHVEFLSTYDFCKEAKQYIENKLKIECRIRNASCNNGITKEIYISHKDQVKKFLDWIYGDATLYLERKYNIYISKYCAEENINSTLTV
jgi:DNA-binding CsgD family transcriptional regulator